MNRTSPAHARPTAVWRLRLRVFAAISATVVTMTLSTAPARADHPNHTTDNVGGRTCTSPRAVALHSYATGSVIHRQYYGTGGTLIKSKGFANGGWQNRWSTHGLTNVYKGQVEVVGARDRSQNYTTCMQ
jgi:hypothetical protein